MTSVNNHICKDLRFLPLVSLLIKEKQWCRNSRTVVDQYGVFVSVYPKRLQKKLVKGVIEGTTTAQRPRPLPFGNVNNYKENSPKALIRSVRTRHRLIDKRTRRVLAFPQTG